MKSPLMQAFILATAAAFAGNAVAADAQPPQFTQADILKWKDRTLPRTEQRDPNALPSFNDTGQDEELPKTALSKEHQELLEEITIKVLAECLEEYHGSEERRPYNLLSIKIDLDRNGKSQPTLNGLFPEVARTFSRSIKEGQLPDFQALTTSLAHAALAYYTDGDDLGSEDLMAPLVEAGFSGLEALEVVNTMLEKIRTELDKKFEKSNRPSPSDILAPFR